MSFLAYTKTVNYFGPAHAVDILRAFLDIVDCNDEVSGLVPELKNVSSSAYSEFLQNKIHKKRLICLFPESRKAKKEWQFFPALTAQLTQILPEAAVCLLGSNCSENYKIPGENFFDLRGNTSIVDIIYIIQNAGNLTFHH